MTEKLRDKYNNLLEKLSGYDFLSVAYSGGVDSTLLTYAACEAVGTENVQVYHVNSQLIAPKSSEKASLIIRQFFNDSINYQIIRIDLFDIDSIRFNKPDRCYYCKKSIYLKLIEENRKKRINILLDGTNIDDLKMERPGSKAVKELGIKTPFVDCDICKHEIRKLAEKFKLPNAFLPSDSCLATRLSRGSLLDEDNLKQIVKFENYLLVKGFKGFRVRPRNNYVIVELQVNDMTRIIEKPLREEIITYFQDHGFSKTLIDLYCRQ